MSFSFGSTSTFPTASTAPTGFGLGAGTSTANKSGFGTSTFAFGSTPAQPAVPSFNLGAAATPSQPSFGFGSAMSTPAATGFPSFGATSTATTTTLTPGTGFGTGTSFSGFGTAATTTTQSSGFSFGSSFNQPATSSSGSLFSSFAAPASTGFGGFGTNTFGAKPAQTATVGGFGGFGSTLGQAQQQQQQQQQPPANPNDALYNSIFHCHVYNDERDSTLSRWNLLQALWGTGKAYYSQSSPPVDITQQNPFCRFKAVGYSVLPSTENKEGLVAIVFNKPEAEITAQQVQLTTSLNSVLGNKPNLSVAIYGVKPMSETKAQVTFYVEEKGVTGVRRIPGVELANFLGQPMPKQQLAAMGADNIFPQTQPDKEMLEAYLETPPAGIDVRLWKQAQLDNPDAEKYVPVPMIGFGDVRWRIKCQEQETKLHQAFLDHAAEDIAQLKGQQARTSAKVTEYKRKFLELEHRILKVLVHQEVCRKVGMALQPDEEVIRSQLETLEAQLNTPTQFKGRLNEMLSQMRMQRQEATHREVERYSMDETAQEDIKQFLALEQNGMSHLVNIIQSDIADLKIIKEGMTQILQGQKS